MIDKKGKKMTKYAILIVEDELIAAKYLQKVLEHNGHEVVGIAISMDSALAYADKQHIDLVLMDIRIEGDSDGIEVAKQFLSKKDVGILYTTAYNDEDFLTRAKQTNTIGYLVKPIQPDSLLSTIEVNMANFMQTSSKAQNSKLCNCIYINKKKFSYTYNDKKVTLSQNETIILALLSSADELEVSYDELEQMLYEDGIHTDTALRTTIWRLRNKLPSCISIETIYKYGYKIKCNR